MTQGKKINVGIVGGAGYTAGELIRILRFHPQAELKYIQSGSNNGKLKLEEGKQHLRDDNPLAEGGSRNEEPIGIVDHAAE